jgi:hypothetical protein
MEKKEGNRMVQRPKSAVAVEPEVDAVVQHKNGKESKQVRIENWRGAHTQQNRGGHKDAKLAIVARLG